MIVLIPESKSMKDSGISAEAFSAPRFEKEATEICEALISLDTSELAKAIKVSPRLADKAREEAYTIANSQGKGTRAIDAYSGTLYRALDFSTLSADAKASACKQVRIVSSLYGLLSPDESILPYRLDFSAKIQNVPSPLYKFWKPKLTIALGKEKPEDIIVILPQDATKCFDWKILKALTNVVVIEFRTMKEDGSLASLNSERLKNRRGIFLRELLEAGIDSLDALSHFNTHNFLYHGNFPYPNHYLYIAD